MPIVQIDWQKIKSRLGDDTALFTLTLRQASMLLGLSEQLTWEKTFRVDDYDWADKDILDADIADLQRNLAMPTNLVDIIQYIDEIEGLLRALQGVTSCCDGEDITGGDEFTEPVYDGVGDVPANVISAGYATGVSDWVGFADYKCMIAYVMVDQMELRLRKLATLTDETGDILGGVIVVSGIIVSLFTVILTGGLSVMAVGILASLGVSAALWKAITDATNLDELADEVVDNKEALVCAIVGGDGTYDSIARLTAKIDELWDGTKRPILRNLNLEPTLKALYAGGYDQQNIAQMLSDSGYDVADFNCICDDALGEYYLIGDFETGIVTEHMNSTSYVIKTPGNNSTYCAWTSDIDPNRFLRAYHNNLRLWAGLAPGAGADGNYVTVYRVKYDYMFGSSKGGRAVLVFAGFDNGSATYYADHSTLVWATIDITLPTPLVCTEKYATSLIFMRAEGTMGSFYIDNIVIEIDAYTTP